MPLEARNDGIVGLVLAEFVVEEDGEIFLVRLKNASAPPVLYKAVRDWLLQCRFVSARTRDGKPVPVRMIQPFNFSIGPP